MAFTQRMVEEIVAWCWQSDELARQRKKAWPLFFGDDDKRPVSYLSGTEERNTRERRFLGYFLFDWRLPSGERPAELAARGLYTGDLQTEALTAVGQARFVLAVAKSIGGGRVILELTKERFEVRYPVWTRVLTPGTAVAAHLIPTRFGHWLLGPGWVNLPFALGPGIRANLAEWQIDAVRLERMLQRRSIRDEKRPELPNDPDLHAAVARMTAWAKEHDIDSLVRSADDWRASVLKHMKDMDSVGLYEEVIESSHDLESEEQINELAGLVSNIWNNTPQPDKGGLSPNEIVRRNNR